RCCPSLDSSITSPDGHSGLHAFPTRRSSDLLKTLRTDYIDLYFYHRDNEDIPAGEQIEIMENFRREGKIRYYGCSNWSTERMKEDRKSTRLNSSHVSISYAVFCLKKKAPRQA